MKKSLVVVNKLYYKFTLLFSASDSLRILLLEDEINNGGSMLVGLTKRFEQVLKDDEFAIAVSHVKSKKKSSTSGIETLFAAEYFNSKTKFVLMLDRHSKRGKDIQILIVTRWP